MQLKDIVKKENVGKYYAILGNVFQLIETKTGELKLVRMVMEQEIENLFTLQGLLRLEGKEMKRDE